MSTGASDDKKSPVESIHDEKPHASPIHVDNTITNINAKLANPLAGLSHEQLMASGAEFARTHGLGHLEEEFKKGALAAQDPLAFETIPYFTEDDKNIFRRELTHRWDHPGTLYYLVILCSVAAAVQGVSSFFFPYVTKKTSYLILSNKMDEAVINGANLFFAPQFNIGSNSGNKAQNEWLLGLVNSAPYVRIDTVLPCLTSSLLS